MESVNFVKGYGRIDPNPSQISRRHKVIAVSLVIFLTLVIGSLIGALIHESSTESEESEPSTLASKSAKSLRTVCSITRYPDSCISSISPLNTPPSNNPLQFFNLSLKASLIQVSSLKNLSGSGVEPALKDCTELLNDSVSQLDRSAELLRVGPGEKVLTEMKISDLQTWISAAMTNQETCVDGLEEMGSTALDEIKIKLKKSNDYMSNTLAILNNIQSLFHKFGLNLP